MLQAEYQEKLRTFKPDYPDMQRLTRPDRRDRPPDRRRGRQHPRLGQGRVTTPRASRKRCSKARIGGLKGDVLDLQSRSIQYNILKREAETNRQLYDGLLQRYKEIGVAGGVGANNISVVDRAEVPDGRHSPRPVAEPRARPAARRVRRRAGRVRAAPPRPHASIRRRRWRRSPQLPVLGVDPAPGRRHHAGAGGGRPALAVRRELPLGAHGAAVRHRARPAAQPAGHQREPGRRQDHHGDGTGAQHRPARQARGAGRCRPAQSVAAPADRPVATPSACPTCWPARADVDRRGAGRRASRTSA